MLRHRNQKLQNQQSALNGLGCVSKLARASKAPAKTKRFALMKDCKRLQLQKPASGSALAVYLTAVQNQTNDIGNGPESANSRVPCTDWYLLGWLHDSEGRTAEKTWVQPKGALGKPLPVCSGGEAPHCDGMTVRSGVLHSLFRCIRQGMLNFKCTCR